jgi:protein-tyrosine phosphatase
MAEAIFKDIIMQKGIEKKFEIFSAGVYAFGNDPASYQAIEVMKNEFNIDLKSHRAKVLDDSDVEKADLIFTMTRHHRDMIIDIYPDAADKVHVLKEFVGLKEELDVIDPFGQDYDIYKSCAYEIEELLFEVLERL